MTSSEKKGHARMEGVHLHEKLYVRVGLPFFFDFYSCERSFDTSTLNEAFWDLSR